MVGRYRKKDMLQTVDTLLRANDAIVRTAHSNPQGTAEALIQCQESAIALGTYIDTLGEMYAGLVHTLEDYCENIYQMNESLSDENLCRKISKKIQKQLTGLYNGIKYDLPEDKKEVVFLPYKASMWDSLESVWKAADADPGCDAYVIPIPYFDKNPDGSFREEHYEGDLYPKNVPITRYDEYDLEERHPDIIYIHNPYDDCNHVTSVHPYFYCKNLKNYTDKLVYIPYFVLKEIDPDDQAEIDGMKHFCFTPGTIYADQVIVQSEKMRQIYINEYIKAAKEMGLGGEHTDRKFQEKKFLGTGSPKIDKVLNTRKEDLEIPTEWLKIIEKSDGSRKKIVLYNTSVNALLQHSEKMLQKMESVFGIFKENKDGVALLWRPHPLIQATIESMRPQLWEEYRKIKDRYIEEGWGIYDDSVDLDRAVVLSDAYYGDESSVVQLCQKAGKMIFLQDCSVRREYRKSLLVSTWILLDDYIYFTVANGNALFRCDIANGHIFFLGSFPDEDKAQCELYRGSVIYRQYLIFLPCNAKRAGVYDVKEKVFVENMWRNLPKKGYYTQRAAGDTEDIYIFGAWNDPYIYRFNPIRDEGHYILPAKETGYGAMRGRMDMGSLWRTDSYFYFPVFTGEHIITFDLVNEELEEIALPERGYHYIAVALIRDIFYLLEDSGKLLSFDCSQKQLKLLFDIEGYVKSNIGGTVFNRLLCDESHLYLVPERYGESIVRYGYDTGEIYFMDKITKKDVSAGIQRGKRSLARICNKQMISFCHETLSLEIIDLSTLERKEIDLSDTDDRTVLYGYNGIVSETSWGTVLPIVVDMLNSVEKKI